MYKKIVKSEYHDHTLKALLNTMIRVRNIGLKIAPVELYQSIDSDQIFLPIHPKLEEEEGKSKNILADAHKKSHYV